jgi:hypothetical protein
MIVLVSVLQPLEELVPFRAFPFRALLKIFPIRASSQVFTYGECRFVRWSADNAGYGHVRNTHPIFLIKDIIQLGVFFFNFTL